MTILLLSLDEIERLEKLTPQGWTWEESRKLLTAARLAHALREENARLRSNPAWGQHFHARGGR